VLILAPFIAVYPFGNGCLKCRYQQRRKAARRRLPIKRRAALCPDYASK